MSSLKEKYEVDAEEELRIFLNDEEEISIYVRIYYNYIIIYNIYNDKKIIIIIKELLKFIVRFRKSRN